jgi:regulatory protein
VTHEKPKFDREKLMNAALRALGMRAHSTGELRAKLRRRGSEEDVEAVMASLKEAGYLNDRQFAENYAATRLQSSLGKIRVIRDLRQRRVAPKLAEQAAEQVYSSTSESELIDEFLRRKYRGKELRPYLADEKHLAAAYRRLRYAGFSAGASIAALNRHASATEKLDLLESEPDPEGPEE